MSASDSKPRASSSSSIFELYEELYRNGDKMMEVVVLHGSMKGLLQRKVPVDTTVEGLCRVIKEHFNLGNVKLLYHDIILEEGRKLRSYGVSSHSLIYSFEIEDEVKNAAENNTSSPVASSIIDRNCWNQKDRKVHSSNASTIEIPMENWRLQLAIGSSLDVRDKESLKWNHARVCDTDGDDLKIHFLGWKEKWDIWAHRSNCNISPAGYHLKFPYRNSSKKSMLSSPDEDEEEKDLREFFIETLDYRVIPVSLVTATATTVKDVKNEIEQSQGIPVKDQELIYRGLPLLDHITLEYYQLPIKCVIGLMVSLASYCKKQNDINNMLVSRIGSKDFYAPMYSFVADIGENVAENLVPKKRETG